METFKTHTSFIN